MKKRTISPLPRGMGSMAFTKDGTIEYKRVLTLKNGEKTRRTVHGNTQLECMKKMEELEKELNTNNKPKNKQTLVEGFYAGLDREFYAYYQWYYNISGSEVLQKIPVEFLKKAYYGLHDLQLELAVKK